MGYNPLRKYRGGKTADISILVAVTAIVLLLVWWAIR